MKKVLTSLVVLLILSFGVYAGSTIPTDYSNINKSTQIEPFRSINTTDEEVVFDQGPTTGSYGGCWANWTEWQNFAEQFTLAATTPISAINIYTIIAPTSGTIHIKVLDNAGGQPGNYLYEEDKVPEVWELDPNSGYYIVTALLSTPFVAQANETYWIGMAGNGFELGQNSVLTPGDGTMAQFNGSVFSFHTGVGDQMFQLLGGVQDVTLDMVPTNPPVVIPPQGGTFKFTATLTNNTAQSQPLDAWIDVILPNGSIYGPVFGPYHLTLKPNAVLAKTLSQKVPGSAPAGVYQYCGHIVFTNGTDDDCFEVTKQ